MKVVTKLAILLAIAVLAYMLAGCGGGGGGGTSSISSPGTTLTIGTDTSLDANKSTTRGDTRDITLTAPLPVGSTIEVLDFATGERLATGTIGDNGKGNVVVPPGKCVVITVTGTKGDKNYRLSTVVACVPVENTEVDLNPVTTIAAEAIGQKYYKKQIIDQASFDIVLTAAQTYAESNPDMDASMGALLTDDAEYGASNVLDSAKLNAVISAVPATIESTLIKGKNTVQQLIEAGLPWQQILDQEGPSMSATFDAFATVVDDAELELVVGRYRALLSRLQYIFIPASIGQFRISGDFEDAKTLWDLTVGKGYEVISNDGRYLIIEENSSIAASGKIVIARGTHTLVATPNGAGSFSIRERDSDDSALNYTATVPKEPSSTVGALATTVSVQDKYLTTPITFSGSITATTTTATVSGTLTSAEVNVNTGTASATFPSSLPTGLQGDGYQTFEFPTAMSLTGTDITVTAGGATAHITGSVNVKLSWVGTGHDMYTAPTEATLSGGAISVSGNSKSASISGSASFKCEHVLVPQDQYDSGYQMFPTDLTLTNGVISATTSAGKIEAKGNATMKAKVLSNDHYDSELQSATFHGEYSNTGTHLAIVGDISFQRTDSITTSFNLYSSKTATAFTGSMQRAGYPSWVVDMAFTTDGAGNADCTINKLGWSNLFITGNAEGTYDSSDHLTAAAINLTNQDGVVIALDKTLSGTMKVDTEKVADISKENGMLKISFVDNSFEYLP
ncbi:MAG: hypothetical protein ABFD54_09780 [Armatimonadota bacterium]|nr:hypothetical protein [bacterium]